MKNLKLNSNLNDNIDLFWKPNTETGFIPKKLTTTPSELVSSEYKSLQILGLIAPKLGSMSDEELEDIVTDLPVDHKINISNIPPEICEAAVRSYVNIAAHLIHRPKFSPRQELPINIAQPLWLFSKHVKRPPSLTYASYVLANLASPVHRRMLPGRLKTAQTPSCTIDEEWFVAVHLSAETAGGEVVEAINKIEESLNNGNISDIVSAIQLIESSIVFIADVMPTVTLGLDRDIFLTEIRPFLYGHNQICFRGIEDDKMVSYIGETGAQSGVIRAISAILNTSHSKEIKESMDKFLDCAPKIHQQYFKDTICIGERLAAINEPTVKKARRSALQALEKFRRTHLNVIMNYLAPEGKPLTNKGTGGTKFQTWLQKVIDETQSSAKNIIIRPNN